MVHLKKDTLLTRFLIMVVLIIILPAVLLYAVYSFFLVESLRSDYNSSMKLSSYMAVKSAGEAISEINNTSLSIISSKSIRDFLNGSREQDSYLLLYSAARSTLDFYRQNNSHIASILISNIDQMNTIISSTTYEKGFHDPEIEKMRDSKGAWFFSSDDDGKVCFCRLIRDTENKYRPIGFLKFVLDTEVLKRKFHVDNPYQDYAFAVLDTKDDQVILSTDEKAVPALRELYEKNLPEIRIRRFLENSSHEYHMLFARLGSRSIDIVTIAKDKSAYFRLLKYGGLILAPSLLFILVLVSAVIYKKGVTKPIESLLSGMQNLKPGSGAPRQVQVRAGGEILTLVNSFNAMAERIDNLYLTNYQNELKLRDANLMILQSEINPHFLYNVLDSIRWMITLDQKEEAIDMIRLLSEMFRQTLVLSSRQVIPLWQELEHLDRYIALEQYRFGDKIQIHSNIQEGVRNASVIKFILQPLIENAIVHGIAKNGTGRGTVIYSVYRNKDDLIYDIRDDGIGADEERIRQILDHSMYKENSLEGFALENIQSRLRLRYGEQYGITCERRENGGSIFIVKQPFLVADEEA